MQLANGHHVCGNCSCGHGAQATGPVAEAIAIDSDNDALGHADPLDDAAAKLAQDAAEAELNEPFVQQGAPHLP